MDELPEFRPPRALRNGHTQSLLASIKLRLPWLRKRARQLLCDAEPVILDCHDGVRLSALYSAHPTSSHPAGQPLAVLIHGWEGSANSQYLLSCAAELYRSGYRVLRLQLRDHGDSHHLNEELFHSCRIDEAVQAFDEIGRRFAQDSPLLLGGFSLGGNFSLRIAARADQCSVAPSAVCAICPVVVPKAALEAMENTIPVYERYFMFKWRRSLRRKRELFPELYSDPAIFERHDMRSLTALLVGYFGEFESIDHYFDGYRISGARLAGLRAPALVLAAEDDPVIPIEHFDELLGPESLHLVKTRYGGHCGYLHNLTGPTYADQSMLHWFDLSLASTDRAAELSG